MSSPPQEEATAVAALSTNNDKEEAHFHKKKRKTLTAADAEFLEQMGTGDDSNAAVAVVAASNAANANANAHAALQELHQSNLLRLQTDELLQESVLYLNDNDQNSHTSGSGGSGGAGGVVKWASFAQEYMQHISTILQEDVSLQNLTLPQDTQEQRSTSTTPICVHTSARLTVANNNNNNNNNNNMTLGMTTLAGNAQCLPTLPLHVQIPDDIFRNTKDYLRDRYFQKRNLIAWHVAQHLAKQEQEHAATVGKVYWRWAHASDQRQVVLILVPPTIASKSSSSNDSTSIDDDSKQKTNKKRKKRSQDTASSSNVSGGPFTSSSMPKKVRFRVQVTFGMQSDAWIPPLRLVPNRCNLRAPPTSTNSSSNNNSNSNIKNSSLPLSPMYNQALTEDALGFKVTIAALSLHHHDENDNKNDDHDDDDMDSMSDDDDDDDDNSTSSDQKEWRRRQQQESYPHWNAATVLAKIWLLQRGLFQAFGGGGGGGGGDPHAANSQLIAIQILYLYRTRRVSPRLGPLQVLAAWFKLLAETNWLGESNSSSSSSQQVQDSSPSAGLIRKAPSEAYRETSHGRGQRRPRRSVLVLPQHVGQTLSQTIAASDLAQLYAQQTKESPLMTGVDKEDMTDPPTLLELYQDTTWYPLGPVLLDSTMRFNFMGRISPATMRLIQTQAAKSLAVLQHDYHAIPENSNTNNNNNNLSSQQQQQQHQHVIQPFSYLFMTSARFWNRHDAYLYIPLKDFDFGSSPLWGNSGSNSNINNKTRGSSSSSISSVDHLERQDYGDYETIARGLIKVLKMTLGDRVRALEVLTTGNGLVGGGGHGRASKEGVGTTTTSNATSTDPSVADSDEIPTFPVGRDDNARSFLTPLHGRQKQTLRSPRGRNTIVLGVSLNSDTCHRVVDRGPPTDDVDATKAFLELWGQKHAELRRFKDGAIVHAVVWESTPSADEQREQDDNDEKHCPHIRFQNEDKVQGGIVERVIQHILKLHFLKKTTKNTKAPPIQFAMRSLVSTVDSVSPRDDGIMTFDPLAAHRMVLKALDCLSEFLRKQSLPTMPIPGSTKLRSRLGIPLAIDAVEPLAPALRYCELFPPMPSPLLGCSPLGKAMGKNKKMAGAVSSDPILIQIRFGASSKWPNDLKAIGAAKTAMLVQLVSGIEQLKKNQAASGDDEIHAFDGPYVVSPGYADIGFMGYVFRIVVRADPELKLLQSLTQPSLEAACLLRTLRRRHLVAAMHHSMVHAVYTSHPSSSFVVRLARRWVASHLLSGLIPFEAVELLVVHVYTDRASPLDAPGTVIAGFLRFLQLLAGHDWSREPLIVDPQGHFTEEDYNAIALDFEMAREKTSARAQHSPPMFIVSPCDRQSDGLDKANDVNKNLPRGQRNNNSSAASWSPTFTLETPEWVVLNRAAQLAQRSFNHLQGCLMTDPFGSSSPMTPSSAAQQQHSSWPSVFHETMESFRAYSAIFRVHPDFLVDTESSSSTNPHSGPTDQSLLVRQNSEGHVWESSYTRSMYQRLQGPKDLRMKKLYKNLCKSVYGQHEDDSDNVMKQSSSLLLEWRPVDSMVDNLRRRLGHAALFFYNDLCPEVVGVLWRPQLFVSKSFSAISSGCVRPTTTTTTTTTTTGAKADGTSLVVVHASDLLREASAYTMDIVVDQKIFYPPLLCCDKEAAGAHKDQGDASRKRRAL